MFELKILNVVKFIEAVNNCAQAVNVLLPTGMKVNINGVYAAQHELIRQFRENNNSLNLVLEFENYTDYMKVMLFAISDNYSYCHD